MKKGADGRESARVCAATDAAPSIPRIFRGIRDLCSNLRVGFAERIKRSAPRHATPRHPYPAAFRIIPTLVVAPCSITLVFETAGKILLPPLSLSLSLSSGADTRRENEVVKIQWTLLPIARFPRLDFDSPR